MAYRGLATGADSAAINGHRASAVRSDGKVVLAYRVNGNILVYETSADRTATALKVTLSPASGTTIDEVTIALGPDNSVHIVYRYQQKLYYGRLNSAYAMSIAFGNLLGMVLTSGIGAFDLDVSENNAPFVAFTDGAYNSCSVRVFMRGTGDGGIWHEVLTHAIFFGAETRYTYNESVSICCLTTVADDTDVVVAFAARGAVYNYTPALWGGKVHEPNGSVSTAFTSLASILAAASAVNSPGTRQRQLMIWRSNAFGGIMIAGMSSANKTIQLQQGEYYSGSGFHFNYTSYTTVASSYFSDSFSMAMSLGPSENAFDGLGVNFYYSNGASLRSTHANINASDGSLDFFHNSQYFPFTSGSYIYWTFVGGNTANSAAAYKLGKHDIVAQLLNSLVGTIGIYHIWAGFGDLPGSGNSGIVELTPADDSINQVANPQLVAKVDLNQLVSQSSYRLEFQFSSDPGFTSPLTYRQPYSKAKVVSGTDSSNVTVTFTDTYTSSVLSGGNYYFRARLVNVWGQVGPWTDTQTFAVGHPPAAVLLSPGNGGLFAWNEGIRTFLWKFTDPASTDVQTAYEVIIYYNEGLIVTDTGKIISDSSSYTAPVLPEETLKDVLMSWNVKLWDSNDTPGSYAPENAYFTLTDPPTVSISTPEADETVDTGIPIITFSTTMGGDPKRTVKSYTVTVSKGSNVVWTTSISAVSIEEETDVTVQVPSGILENNTSYSAQVNISDSGGLTAVSSSIPFTVAWDPADTPTGVAADTSQYNIADGGYVEVIWEDTAREAEFTSWNIYRKDDLIDPYTQEVVEEGSWKQIFTNYEILASYSYKDFFAPSGYKITYAVTQMINHLGQSIESMKAVADSVYPSSEGYWLIQPNDTQTDASVFKLSMVTEDSYSPEQEEAEMIVIGRGRVFNKGQRLGYKGSLTAQLRNTDGTTARQKKLRLEQIQGEVAVLWLRNPFGDTFKVNLSAMTVSRIAGVGTAEFCNVTVPYAKVV